jgi:hypothetical protein
MSNYGYFVLLGLIQLAHSQEEIWTGFHKRWFVFTMPRWVFITFEILFSLPIIAYIAKPSLPLAHWYMPLFALAMFVNGIGHIVWGLVKRSYVPGLITAPLFVVVFFAYYVHLIKVGS